MNNPFKYCIKCASKNVVFQEDKKIKCKDCNAEYFHNVAGATAVILKKEDKVLLTIRNQEPKKGFLDLPGGFIDPFESAESGLIREIKEELNIDLNINKLNYLCSYPNQYEYKSICYHTIDLIYEYTLDQNITTFDKEEISDICWVEINSLDLEKIAFESQKLAIKKGLLPKK